MKGVTDIQRVSISFCLSTRPGELTDLNIKIKGRQIPIRQHLHALTFTPAVCELSAPAAFTCEGETSGTFWVRG